MFRRSAALAAAVLLLAGVVVAPEATAADQLVTVSGTVTGAPGDDDFWLTFARLGDDAPIVYDPYVTATPEYTAQLPPGRYHVFISTDESASAWLGGSPFATGSEVLVVPAGGLTRDIALSPDFGSISGVVDGFPAGLNHLITVTAVAYDAATGWASGLKSTATPIGDGFDGAFTISGLAPGTYHLRGYTEPDIGPPYEYLPEVTVVTVTAGATTDVGSLTFTHEPVQYDRVSGADRFQTSAALASTFFDEASTDVVFIASGTTFPDALSAAPAAAVNGAPVLLVPPRGIPASVRAELLDIAPATIYVIGGPGAVSMATETELRSFAAHVERVDGTDRYETSRAVAEKFFTDPGIVYIATGRNFPDALAASAVAGALGGPLVLVDGVRSSLDGPTDMLLDGFDAPMIIAGDAGVVSRGIEAGLVAINPDVQRRGGVDRYDTAIAVSGALPLADTWFYATGTGFADAASGAAAAGHLGSPLRLVRPSCDPSWFSLGRNYGQGPREVVVVGGEGAIRSSALQVPCAP